MTVKIGDAENRWRGYWDKSRLKRAKILLIQFYFEYPLSLKYAIMSMKCPKYVLSLDASKVKEKKNCFAIQIVPF